MGAWDANRLKGCRRRQRSAGVCHKISTCAKRHSVSGSVYIRTFFETDFGTFWIPRRHKLDGQVGVVFQDAISLLGPLLGRLWRDREPLAGCGYRGVAGDDGIEPRDLEHPSHLRAGTCQAQSPAVRSRREKAVDNDVCAGAVDLLDACEVEDQLLLVLAQQIADQRLEGARQIRR